MIHPLFIEISKFEQWAKDNYNLPPDLINQCDWEFYYPECGSIYTDFEDFIKTSDLATWTTTETEKLLYIIARDNEAEYLAESVSQYEPVLIFLTNQSILKGEADSKWLLAIQLHNLTNKELAKELLEKLVNDDNEYVCRRAIMEFAKMQSDKVEYYCEIFWNRNKYTDGWDEYQRIAVLYSLKEINSKLFPEYIKLAKEDGREFLIKNALELEQNK